MKNRFINHTKVNLKIESAENGSIESAPKSRIWKNVLKGLYKNNRG